MGRAVILCGAVKVRLLAWLSRVLRYPTISDLIYFYVVSNNKYSYRDMAHARDVLGFEPEGDAEDYR